MDNELIDKILRNILISEIVFSLALAICVYEKSQQGMAIFGVIIFCEVMVSAYFEYLRIKKE